MHHMFIANSGPRFFLPIVSMLCGAIVAAIPLSGLLGRANTPVMRRGMVLIGIGLATNAFSLLFAPVPWWRRQGVSITGLFVMLAGDVVLFRVAWRRRNDAKRARGMAAHPEVL